MLLAAVLTILLMLGYDSVRPVVSGQNRNFIPLPKTFPDDSPTKATYSCETLSKCNNGSCAHCDPSYRCTEIAPGEQVYFEGEKVPPGQWCLPPGKTEVACGPATGRAVYDLEGGWKCVCLYPDVYGGKDCTVPLACKVPDAPEDIDQSGNVLINRETGAVYDITSTSTTPYDTDALGRPLYVCRCDSSKTKKFVRLPNDPYRCHLDPCSEDSEIPFWNTEQGKCDCTAGGAVNNEYAYSNVTRTCVRTPQCAWDDDKQQCMCPEGQVSFTCSSDTMTRSDTKTKPCPNVPGGSYCKNPCDGYCLNGGIGRIEGTECVCKCPKHETMEFKGKRCDDVCMKDGVSEPQRKCCSGKRSRVFYGEFPNASYYWKCG